MAFLWLPPDDPVGTTHRNPWPLWSDWLDESIEAHPAVQRLALLWLLLVGSYALAGWLL